MYFIFFGFFLRINFFSRKLNICFYVTYTLELADWLVEFESSSIFDGLTVGTGVDAIMLVCRMLLPLNGANGGTGSQLGLYASSIASAFFSIIVAGIWAFPAIVAFRFDGTVPVGVFMTIVAFGSLPMLTFVTFIDAFVAVAAAN